MKHIHKVESDWQWFWAQCNCGWKSMNYARFESADYAGSLHCTYENA